jgi:hypothetical protein
MMVMMEPMVWPRRHADFPAWLVPARDSIQRELLRIKELLAALPQTTEEVHASLDESLLNLMLGAAFSLWRSVFHAGHQYDQGAAVNTAREFAGEVVRNEASIHATELNAWLLGYYLSGARLRLAQAVRRWPEYLGHGFFQSYKLTEIGPTHPTFTPESWGQCLAALNDLLSSYEGRAERMRTEAQARSGASPTDSKPEPTIVGCTDGTYAVLDSDGAAASFVDGKWQPGMAFESRDFLDMSMIRNRECRSLLLTMAAEALAKSRER